jgi:hypothetical protein
MPANDDAHTMLARIGVGLGLVVLTTIVQATFMLIGVRFLDWRKARILKART